MKDVVPIHGSDHCPGGPDPIPCLETGDFPYAVMEFNNGVTIPDDSKTQLDGDIVGEDWSDGYINDAGLAMTPQPFDFDFHNGLITFRSSGLYHAQFSVNWSDTFPAGPSYLATILSYFGNAPLFAPAGDWMSTDVMFNNQDWMQNWPHATGHVISVADEDTDSSFAGAVIQKSGGDKDLSSAALIVVKLASFDATTGSFLP